MTDPYGNPPAVLSDWAREEMARNNLIPYDAEAHSAANFLPETGYFCVASGCFEDRRDSHGECLNCGEPVVFAMVDPNIYDHGGWR